MRLHNYTDLEILSLFGYPKIGDNARLKPDVIYDKVVITAGQTEYPLFVSDQLSNYWRKRKLPLASSEVFFINGIKATGDFFLNPADKPLNELLFESYLEIKVDDRIQLKVPMLEIYNFGIIQSSLSQYFVHRNKTLQYPVVVNSNSNVSINFVTTTNLANNVPLNAILRFEFSGYKADKLTSFEWDNLKSFSLQKLNYSLYDVLDINLLETTYDLFSNANKPKTEYVRTLPLSDKENFQIEAIETYHKGKAGSNIIEVNYELSQLYLSINVDDVQLYSGGDFLQHSFMTSEEGDNETVYDVIQRNKVLETPIIIPANSKTSIKLQQPALNHIASESKFIVVFKGTLIRRVA